jgi:hypothetical protein
MDRQVVRPQRVFWVGLLAVGLLALHPGAVGGQSPRLPPAEGLADSKNAPSWTPLPLPALSSDSETESTPTRRVNAPYFDDEVPFSETAIFWLGRVDPVTNYADVRVGYNDEFLFVHITTFDRRLWYEPYPSASDLTAWDAVTLYLERNGNTGKFPAASSYRFDAQLVWWEPRDDFQANYVGDGSGWTPASLPFTTESGWRGDVPNDNVDDRGWTLAFWIPFASLGQDAPPPQGTLWGLALALHDRDDEQGTPIPDQIWPEAMDPQQPVTWGQLAFGLPSYHPPASVPGEAVVIRHGLDQAVVVDADVGGSSLCGDLAAPDYFSTWGTLNYAGKDFLNIQNQYDVADWPCFSKYFVSFPLDEIPPAKVIVSATLTLRQWGHAGEGWTPGPQPSLIQALTVAEGWDEATINWNNAPLAWENISATWAEPLEEPGWPGEDRTWDVSVAVAAAYAAGGPVRLALYEADDAAHSGKYFYSSDNWYEEGRPTLRVTWGHPLGAIEKTATPHSAREGDPVTYLLSVVGTGQSLTLTDTLPVGLGTPGGLVVQGTSVTPAYDAAQHRLTWSDTTPAGQQVTIRYSADVTASAPQALINVAELRTEGVGTSTATATVLANPHTLFFPVIWKEASSRAVTP